VTSFEFEVNAQGTVEKAGYTLELSAKTQDALAKLPPLTLVRLEGEYHRPSREVRHFRCGKVPQVLALPRDRALASLRHPADLSRFIAHLPAAESATICALRAVDALTRDAASEAVTFLKRCIDLLPERDVDAPLGLAWQKLVERGEKHAQHLTAEQRARLTRHVWACIQRLGWSFEWGFWADPLVCSTMRELKDDRPRVPWHFGGPRVTPDDEALWRWFEARVDKIADAAEVQQIERLRALSKAELDEWVKDVERREEQQESDAYNTAVEEWIAKNPDSEDSPPDDLGSGTVERTTDELPFRWAAARVCGHLWRLSDGLVELFTERRTSKTARAFALLLDAAVILSGTRPDLVPRARRVVYGGGDATQGFGVVLLQDPEAYAVLSAPEGAFGAWNITETDAAGVIASAPEPQRARVEQALSPAA
jgi:hypothetical protein